MKVTICAMIGAVTVVSVTPVSSLAQSNIRQNPLPANTSQSSNALLEGINNRSAEDDFSRFFGVRGNLEPNRNNTSNSSSDVLSVTYQESMTLPDTPIFLQPAQSNGNGNDGVQVQLNLQDLDRPSQK